MRLYTDQFALAPPPKRRSRPVTLPGLAIWFFAVFVLALTGLLVL